MRTRLLVVAATALLLPIDASAEIGTVAAVNREMDGTPPALQRRTLVFGDLVVSDELIETSASGTGQLLFVDRSSLTVGPNSRLLLDRFIYNPERQTGEIAVSLTLGTLRFIGGQITKGQEAIIRTPKATIALRGGMLIATVDPSGDTQVVNIASTFVTVTQYGDADGDGIDDGAPGDSGETGEAQSVTVSRPGAVVEAGETVEFTGFVSTEELGEIYGSLEGTGGGGTEQPPSAGTVDAEMASLSSLNSGAVGAPYQEPVSTTGEVEPQDGSGSTQEETSSGGNQNFNTVGQQVAIDDPLRNVPDPARVAALTGTASYSGPASGTLTEPAGTSRVSGGFVMTYDFGARSGALDLNMLNNLFTVDVAADPANAATYSGSNVIFGGPDSVSAQGTFLPGGADPAATTNGNFQIDLQTQNSSVSGTFAGQRR